MIRPDITPEQSASIREDFEAMNSKHDDLPWIVVALFLGALAVGFIGGGLIISAIERAAYDAHEIRTHGYVAMMERQP